MEYLIRIKPLFIDGEKRLGFDLRYCPQVGMHLQNLRGWRQWGNSNVWHVPYYDNHLAFLEKRFGHLAIFHNIESNLKTQHVEKKSSIQKECSTVPAAFFQYMRLKRYSQNTQSTYVSVLKKFLNHYKRMSTENLTDDHVKRYMIFLVDTMEGSEAL